MSYRILNKYQQRCYCKDNIMLERTLGLPTYALVYSDHYIYTENSQTWELQCHMFVDCTSSVHCTTYPDPHLKSSKITQRQT